MCPYPEPKSQSEGLAAAAPAVLSLQEGVHLLTVPAQCTAPLQYGNAVPAGEAGSGRLADGLREMRGRRGQAPTGASRRNEDPRGRSCKDAPEQARESAS